jgi:hypothetical protein
MLSLAFAPKIWTLQWKLGNPLCFIIISIVYKFWSFELYKIISLFYYWLCCKFVIKVIMFQEALQFCSTIVLCYNKQIVVRVIGWVPPHLIHIIRL